MVATLIETIETRPALPLQIAIKGQKQPTRFDLEDKLLLEIGNISERYRECLLRLVASKLHTKSAKKALNIALELTDDNKELTQAKALVKILFSTDKAQQKLITKELMTFLNQMTDYFDIRSLLGAMINQLELNKNNQEHFAYIRKFSKKLVKITNNLHSSDKVTLDGRVYRLLSFIDNKLAQDNFLYKKQHQCVVKIERPIKSSRELYFILLEVLENFPLAEQNRIEVFTLCIQVLRDITSDLNPWPPNYFSIENITRLLKQLPEQERKILAIEIYGNGSFDNKMLYDPNSTLSCNLSSITEFAYCSGVEEIITDVKLKIIKQIKDLYESTQVEDSEYHWIVYFLVSKEWSKSCDNKTPFDQALSFIKKMKQLEHKAETILLVLEKTKPGKFRRTLLKEALATRNSMRGEYKIVLEMELLRYFPSNQRKLREQIIFTILEKIGSFINIWYEFITESFPKLIKELSPSLIKKCFQIIEKEESEKDRIWFLLVFMPYLAKTERIELINKTFQVIRNLTNQQDKVEIFRQLSRYGF